MAFVNRSSEGWYCKNKLESLELEKYQLSFVNIKDNVMNQSGVRGACMDEFTQNIFITVSVIGMVYVYDINGTFLYQFGSKSPLTLLRNPWYNYISRSLLYVTDYSVNQVSIYTLEGEIITSFHGLGNGEAKYKFKRPNGVVTEPLTGDFYICDTDNNRIMFVHDLGLGVTTFGEGVLSSPHEIRLSKETLFILSNGMLYTFSLIGTYLSKTDLEVSPIYGYYFEIGENNEFIISNAGENIYLLDSTGKLLSTYNKYLEHNLGHLPCIIKCKKTHIVAIQMFGGRQYSYN